MTSFTSVNIKLDQKSDQRNPTQHLHCNKLASTFQDSKAVILMFLCCNETQDFYCPILLIGIINAGERSLIKNNNTAMYNSAMKH